MRLKQTLGQIRRGREGEKKKKKVGEPQHEKQQDGGERVIRSVEDLCVQREERRGTSSGLRKASPPSTTFTDALFTATQEQLYGSVMLPFVTANGTKSKTKISKEQAKESVRERETGEDSSETFCEIFVTSTTGAGGSFMSVCMSKN